MRDSQAECPSGSPSTRQPRVSSAVEDIAPDKAFVVDGCKET
jgi:hypothetical protein